MEGATRIEPGRLYHAGPVSYSTGGAVSNTGLALHRLGISVKLIGKVGDDQFGRTVLDLFQKQDATLATSMMIARGEHTSYSIVISPPNVDRSFLHNPGANDTFRLSEINWDDWPDVGIVHFGYPPLMELVYADGGRELADFFAAAHQRGMTTSLDMSMPDPSSPAGAVNWREWLTRVLPHVDFYLPSLEETEFMLRRPGQGRSEPAAPDSQACEENGPIDHDHLWSLAEELLGFGASVVVLKLGEHGLYLRTAELNSSALSLDWRRREMLAPCFQVDAIGTTGAGDSTIAGFLAAVHHHAEPAEALVQAVAVGAFCVEASDALSGVRSLAEVARRVNNGWSRRTDLAPGAHWKWAASPGVWIGPHDSTSVADSLVSKGTVSNVSST